MTNREFLKKFVTQMIGLNTSFRAMPKWKLIGSIFLRFVAEMSGIYDFVVGILAGSKPAYFLGFLTMCAWAGLICSLVFHLSLALLIPSVIILSFTAFLVSAKIISTQKQIDKMRQKQGKDIDKFFHLIDEINNYLDTFDLPQEKISSGEENSKKPPIDEKYKMQTRKRMIKKEVTLKRKKVTMKKMENNRLYNRHETEQWKIYLICLI